jgi:hypothetical protein
MKNNEHGETIGQLEKRIKELGEKSNQMLLFLSVAVVGTATLFAIPNREHLKQADLDALRHFRSAMSLWGWAFVPVLFGVLPVKELYIVVGDTKDRWYRRVRRAKVILMWIAVGLSMWGGLHFLGGVRDMSLIQSETSSRPLSIR